MYSEKLLKHFSDPRNVGDFEDPAARRVEVSNPACGDILKLAVLWEGDRVVGARYQVRGCTASIACGSAVAEWMEGRTRAELAALRAGDVEALVDGLIAESKHAAVLLVDGVKALLRG
jgi:nitrogen fixation NifU-like protein